jgi:hypothetical protein
MEPSAGLKSGEGGIYLSVINLGIYIYTCLLTHWFSKIGVDIYI